MSFVHCHLLVTTLPPHSYLLNPHSPKIPTSWWSFRLHQCSLYTIHEYVNATDSWVLPHNKEGPGINIKLSTIFFIWFHIFPHFKRHLMSFLSVPQYSRFKKKIIPACCQVENIFLRFLKAFLMCISQSSPEKQNQREKERDWLIMRNWLINYSSQGISWSAIYKLEIQESQWCSSSVNSKT